MTADFDEVCWCIFCMIIYTNVTLFGPIFLHTLKRLLRLDCYWTVRIVKKTLKMDLCVCSCMHKLVIWVKCAWNKLNLSMALTIQYLSFLIHWYLSPPQRILWWRGKGEKHEKRKKKGSAGPLHAFVSLLPRLLGVTFNLSHFPAGTKEAPAEEKALILNSHLGCWYV